MKLLALAACSVCFLSAELRFPARGIERDISGFRYEDRVIASDRIFLDEGVALVVETAILAADSSTRFLMHLAGRNNIEAYRRLSYGIVAPGISAAVVAEGNLLQLRFTVAPGANVGDIHLRVDAGGQAVSLRREVGVGAGLYWTSGGREGRIFYPTVSSSLNNGWPQPFGTYQILEGGRFELVLVPFGPAPSGTVYFDIPFGRFNHDQPTEPVTDIRGNTWIARGNAVARFASDDSLESLTIVDGLDARRGVPGVGGEFVVAGSRRLAVLQADGVSHGAPIDADGFVTSIEAGTDGAVHFAAATSLGRWTPGQPKFDFMKTQPADVFRIAAAPAGQTVVSYPSGHGLRLDWLSATGELVRNVFLPLADPASVLRTIPGPIAVGQGGSIWLAGGFDHVVDGRGNVLFKLNADGSRVLYAASSPMATERLVADDSSGVLQFGATEQLSHATPPDAMLRGACDSLAAHYRRLDSEGRLLDATYVWRTTAVLSRHSGLELFGGGSDPSGAGYLFRQGTRAREPGVSCVVDAASRQPQFGANLLAAPGQLVTIVGQRLGARPRVRVDGQILNLVSTEPGLITVRIPSELAVNQVVELAIDTEEGTVSRQLEISNSASFGFATTDNHGWGPAAALNQDGSLNSRERPAMAGSVISLFGTGLEKAREVFLLVDDQFIVRPEFVGPAPLQAGGVTQVNFRIPPETRSGRIVISVAKSAPIALGYWPKPRVTIEVRGLRD